MGFIYFFLLYFKVTTRKLKISHVLTFVVCNRFLSDSITLEYLYSADAQTLVGETNRNKCY